ncbi:MAG: hypothetical protein WB988_11315, partial [Candidatus Nitrosopolaris sp.]
LRLVPFGDQKELQVRGYLTNDLNFNTNVVYYGFVAPANFDPCNNAFIFINTVYSRRHGELEFRMSGPLMIL